ncbi:MAG: hypothetical protein JWM74_6310 [Myxococcaceae bacterium]|nr:hypothetical protein [Myxococcaceae bacterium]
MHRRVGPLEKQLRCHVLGRAPHALSHGGKRLPLGDAEVEEHRAARVHFDHDVGGLHVPMKDAAAMKRRERRGKRGDDRERGARRHERVPIGKLPELGLQAVPVHELHRQVLQAIELTERMHLHDVLVPEPCENPRLLMETREVRFVASERRRDDLDRHMTAEHPVVPLVDDAHGALTEDGDDLVGADSHGNCVCQRRHIRLWLVVTGFGCRLTPRGGSLPRQRLVRLPTRVREGVPARRRCTAASRSRGATRLVGNDADDLEQGTIRIPAPAPPARPRAVSQPSRTRDHRRGERWALPIAGALGLLEGDPHGRTVS